MNLTQSLRTLILALVLSIGISYAYAAVWSSPKAGPTSNNTEAPINVGPVAQLKDGGLGLGRSGFPALLDVVGNVVVSRTIKIGDIVPSNTACSAVIAGSIKYDGTDLMGCVGGSWKSLTAAGGSGGGGGLTTYDWTNCSVGCVFKTGAGITQVTVQAMGGGGGGGSGGDSGNTPSGGGGGGGGGYFTSATVPVLPETDYTVTVGRGGLSDQSGTQSLFGSLVTAQGGSSGSIGGGGDSNNPWSYCGGGGGGGSGNTAGLSGTAASCPADPISGILSINGPAGGGGNGGASGSGANGGGGGTGGNGGSSGTGYGAGGGGGSGRLNVQGGTAPGGNGSPGFVTISW